MAMIRWISIVLLFTAPLIVACSPGPPEERLATAADNLADTSVDLDGVNDEIERLEARLEALRNDRQRLRSRQRSLEQRVEARATDVAIFRFIQRELLELDGLRTTAIAVAVEDQRVTLWGTVASEAQVEIAVAAANRAPGVATVKSRILIDEEGPAPSADKLAN